MKAYAYRIHWLIQLLGLRKKIYRGDHKVRETFRRHRKMGSSTALDLGSGPAPRNPFEAREIHGVDIRSYESNNVTYADLSSGIIPFPSNTFDFISAYDVLEHIPRVISNNGKMIFPLVMLMNEIFRVLKSDGIFFNIQPCYPFKESFQDPTHVNIMTEDTMNLYFCEPAWARIYGYEGSFSMMSEGWVGPKYYSFLKKIHNESIKNLDFVQK